MVELADQVGRWALDLYEGIRDQSTRGGGGEVVLTRIEKDVAKAYEYVTLVIWFQGLV
jgi:hypothetical protein